MPDYKKINKLRGKYILDAFKDYSLNGDVYLPEYKLYQVARNKRKQLKRADFDKDYRYLLEEGHLAIEGNDVYLSQTLQYENYVAKRLANLLRDIKLRMGNLSKVMLGNGKMLTKEQQEAVQMALGNKLSIILGGAGTGKTTLIEAIVEHGSSKFSDEWCLCAPTGKAARNLTERSGLEANTLHSTLKRGREDDFLMADELEDKNLIIVDEASMLTLEMLAGLLKAAPKDSRIVLVGDPNQLPSVGAGNVLLDLLELGVPSKHLKTCHRQAGADGALLNNVQYFSEVNCFDHLNFDESFCLQQKYSIKEVSEHLCKYAAKLYRQGQNIQVLSPFNQYTDLSVAKLNENIQNLVNPLITHDAQKNKQLGKFRNGDRVMINQNNKQNDVCNGDIGTLYIKSDDDEKPEFSVLFSDGRSVSWNDVEGLSCFNLAYAITVHKSQGSEYTEIIMPLIPPFNFTLNRNLIYTAISRAKKRVTLMGNAEVLDEAIKAMPKERLSKLVRKTQACFSKNQLKSGNIVPLAV